MSSKNAKKIRQYYNRNVKQFAIQEAKIVGNAMKPKPKFIPMWLWMKGISIFIKVNKTGIKK